MKAVILAAGKGERMRPLTDTIPKPMISVLGKPLLAHTFDVLPESVDEVVLVVKYLGQTIKDYFGNNFNGRKIIYAEGSELGTAYSFLSAKKYLEKEENFLFLYGDEYPAANDIEKCLKYKSSILCWQVDDPWNHGVSELNSAGMILNIAEKPEKPKSNLIAGGVMVLTPKIFIAKPVVGKKNEFYLTDMLNQYFEKEKTKAVISDRAIGGFSTPKDIERLEKYIKNNLINK